MKKRIIISFIVAIILISNSSFSSYAAQKPEVKAHSYVIQDSNAGKVLFSSNANKKIYPASTVKVMTAVVTLDNISANKRIRFTKSMKAQSRYSSAAHFNIKVGISYRVKDYLHMLLISSDASSAIALSNGVFGSKQEFIDEMNEKARNLGMTKTRFDNPIGLDKGDNYNKTYSSASDFAKLSRYAMSKKIIRDIVAKRTYVVPKTVKAKAFRIHNTNSFYSHASYTKTRYKIIGLKTGTTKAAGKVLIAVARDKQGHEVTCAFFGKSSESRKYKDIRKLLDYTFSQYDNGIINLSSGYWDTRFRESDKCIRKYLNKGMLKLPSNGCFYPEKKVNASQFMDMFNSITHCSYVYDIDSMMSVKDFVDMIKDNAPSNVDQSIVDKWNLKVDLSAYDDDEKKQASFLLENGVIKAKDITNPERIFTKEQSVLLADRYNCMITAQN